MLSPSSFCIANCHRKTSWLARLSMDELEAYALHRRRSDDSPMQRSGQGKESSRVCKVRISQCRTHEIYDESSTNREAHITEKTYVRRAPRHFRLHDHHEWRCTTEGIPSNHGSRRNP